MVVEASRRVRARLPRSGTAVDRGPDARTLFDDRPAQRRPLAAHPREACIQTRNRRRQHQHRLTHVQRRLTSRAVRLRRCGKRQSRDGEAPDSPGTAHAFGNRRSRNIWFRDSGVFICVMQSDNGRHHSKIYNCGLRHSRDSIVSLYGATNVNSHNAQLFFAAVRFLAIPVSFYR